MSDEKKIVNMPENEWVNVTFDERIKSIERLQKWWDLSGPTARRELLDDSGLVDLATDTLQELADAFDLLVALRFNDLPPDFQGYLIERTKVVHIKDGVYDIEVEEDGK
jgi:hypothetical protein